MHGHNGHGPRDPVREFYEKKRAEDEAARDAAAVKARAAAATKANPDPNCGGPPPPAPWRGAWLDWWEVCCGRRRLEDLNRPRHAIVPAVATAAFLVLMIAETEICGTPYFGLAFSALLFAAFCLFVASENKRWAEEAAAAYEQVHGPFVPRTLLQLLCDMYWGRKPHPTKTGFLLSLAVDMATLSGFILAFVGGLVAAFAVIAPPLILSALLGSLSLYPLFVFAEAALLTLAARQMALLEGRLTGTPEPSGRWRPWVLCLVRYAEPRHLCRHVRDAMPERPVAAVALDVAARAVSGAAAANWVLLALLVVLLILALCFRS